MEMTVKDLIEALKRMPQDDQVVDFAGYKISEVMVDHEQDGAEVVRVV